MEQFKACVDVRNFLIIRHTRAVCMKSFFVYFKILKQFSIMSIDLEIKLYYRLIFMPGWITMRLIEVKKKQLEVI